MPAIKLATVVLKALTNGPTRIVTQCEGRGRNRGVSRADTPDVANKAGIFADRILIRADGWTLGCRLADLAAARSLWAGEWVAEIAA